MKSAVHSELVTQLKALMGACTDEPVTLEKVAALAPTVVRMLGDNDPAVALVELQLPTYCELSKKQMAALKAALDFRVDAGNQKSRFEQVAGDFGRKTDRSVRNWCYEAFDLIADGIIAREGRVLGLSVAIEGNPHFGARTMLLARRNQTPFDCSLSWQLGFGELEQETVSVGSDLRHVTAGPKWPASATFYRLIAKWPTDVRLPVFVHGPTGPYQIESRSEPGRLVVDVWPIGHYQPHPTPASRSGDT